MYLFQILGSHGGQNGSSVLPLNTDTHIQNTAQEKKDAYVSNMSTDAGQHPDLNTADTAFKNVSRQESFGTTSASKD